MNNMSMSGSILSQFWSPNVWLPPGIGWDDIKPTEEMAYADYRHLFIPVPLAFVFFGLRVVLERYWLAPIGISLGIKNTKAKRAPPNEIMEQAYHTPGRIRHKQIASLAKRLDWSERKVERWLRLRRSQDRPSTLIKFCESGWRWLFYTYSFTFGLVCLWDKPWLWNINECWYGYPLKQVVTWDCWWYYMGSLAFYWSLAVSQFFDVVRKDFWQMFVHHLATISLLSFSWVCNLHRIGTLVLIVHDCPDVLLEAAKLAKYANYQKLCDILFSIFTLVWIVARLGIYPFYMLYSTTVDAPRLVAMFPAYYIFNGLLITLLFLHIYWTYVILKIAYKSVIAGKMEGDIRSSSSELTEEESGPTGNHTTLPSSPSSRKISHNSSPSKLSATVNHSPRVKSVTRRRSSHRSATSTATGTEVSDDASSSTSY